MIETGRRSNSTRNLSHLLYDYVWNSQHSQDRIAWRDWGNHQSHVYSQGSQWSTARSMLCSLGSCNEERWFSYVWPDTFSFLFLGACFWSLWDHDVLTRPLISLLSLPLLMSLSIANRVKIASLGGIQAIIEAMSAYKDNSGVQEKACGALWNLTAYNDGICLSFFLCRLGVFTSSFFFSSDLFAFFWVQPSLVFMRSYNVHMWPFSPFSMLCSYLCS